MASTCLASEGARLFVVPSFDCSLKSPSGIAHSRVPSLSITIDSDRSVNRNTNAEPAAPLLRKTVYARFHAQRRRVGSKRLRRRGKTLYVSDAEVCILLITRARSWLMSQKPRMYRAAGVKRAGMSG